jgi:hypothetical protein
VFISIVISLQIFESTIGPRLISSELFPFYRSDVDGLNGDRSDLAHPEKNSMDRSVDRPESGFRTFGPEKNRRICIDAVGPGSANSAIARAVRMGASPYGFVRNSEDRSFYADDVRVEESGRRDEGY